jgi:hypothetical protein
MDVQTKVAYACTILSMAIHTNTIWGCQCPLACQSLHPFEVLGPIVQCRRVKICTIGPHQRMDLQIELGLAEERRRSGSDWASASG